MSTLYKQRDVWYLDVIFNNTRIRKSLRTNQKEIAKKIAKKAEAQIIKSLITGDESGWNRNTSEGELIHLFLKAKHDISPSTLQIYKERLVAYRNLGFTGAASTKAMTIRCLNKMYRWAYDNKLISKAKKIEGGGKWENRMRTFNENELKLILNEVTPHKFQLFVRFAYYTGARRGEIASLREENITQEFVSGKSGKRQIKLNSQAKEILTQVDELWGYKLRYISQRIKKNLRRLGIKDGRFHDLRRTFGLNLIKQGMPIYEVSKLLGHSSVRTTEKHYAPLLITEIRDFKL